MLANFAKVWSTLAKINRNQFQWNSSLITPHISGNLSKSYGNEMEEVAYSTIHPSTYSSIQPSRSLSVYLAFPLNLLYRNCDNCRCCDYFHLIRDYRLKFKPLHFVFLTTAVLLLGQPSSFYAEVLLLENLRTSERVHKMNFPPHPNRSCMHVHTCVDVPIRARDWWKSRVKGMHFTTLD